MDVSRLRKVRIDWDDGLVYEFQRDWHNWTVKFSDGAATTLLLAPDGTWVEIGYSATGSVLYVTIQSQEWVEHFIAFCRLMGATVEGFE